MSDTHQDANHAPIKFMQPFLLASAAGFVVAALGIIGVSMFASGDKTSDADAAAVAQRIQKVGQLQLQEANRPLQTGAQVYAAQCAACHAAGVAGAPKFQDAAAWSPRIAKGYEALLTSALKGKGAMSPQGGGNFSDLEIGRAVVHMANAAGAKLAEPAAPAGAAAAPAAAAAPVAAAAAEPAATSSAEAKPAAAPVGAAADAATGKALYDKSCVTCHGAGVAGAPKLGDKAAWGPRVATGMEALMKSAVNGKNAMPPRGASTASDAELQAAVQYMVDAAK